MLAQDADTSASKAASGPLGPDLVSIAVCSLIWGTTWFAITLQLGPVDPTWSIIYRFTLAALLMFGWLALTRRRIALTRAQHLAALGVGLFTFAIDYGMVYAAEQRVPSAVVAITFAALSLCTQILFRVLAGRRASPLAWLGSALGVVGVGCLFAEQLARAPIAAHAAIGLGFALIGMLAAAIGNYFAWRQERAGGEVVPSTAWSMAYGVALLVGWALVTRAPIGFDLSAKYLLSLIYLAVFGSVVAFLVYYALARRRSYALASYVSALTPPTAMLASTVFEGVRWGPLALVGLAIVLAGQLLLIRAPKG
jgi:drug/metabolite transporter (DMT)-like permease